jgi:hypothetical protein
MDTRYTIATSRSDILSGDPRVKVVHKYDNTTNYLKRFFRLSPNKGIEVITKSPRQGSYYEETTQVLLKGDWSIKEYALVRARVI